MESQTEEKKVEITPQDQIMMDMGIMEKPAETPTAEKPAEVPAEKPMETPETPAEQIQNQFDWEKATKGKVKTEDELNTIFTEHETIKKDYTPLKENFEKLQKDYERVKNSNPFEGDETLYKAHKLAKELNRTDYQFLINIVQSDFTAMSDFDVLKTKELLENGEIYKGKENLLDGSLIDHYNISKPEDFEELEESEQKKINDRVAINELKMAKDAKAARLNLQEIQGKYKFEAVDPKVKEQQEQDKKDKFVSTWKTPYQSIAKEFTSIKIEGSKGVYEIPIREEDAAIRDQVIAAGANYLYDKNLEYTQENIQDVKEKMADLYVTLNRKFYADKLVEIGHNMSDEEWQKSVHNPTPIKIESQRQEIKKTPEDEAIEKMQNGN